MPMMSPAALEFPSPMPRYNPRRVYTNRVFPFEISFLLFQYFFNEMCINLKIVGIMVGWDFSLTFQRHRRVVRRNKRGNNSRCSLRMVIRQSTLKQIHDSVERLWRRIKIKIIFSTTNILRVYMRFNLIRCLQRSKQQDRISNQCAFIDPHNDTFPV